MNIACCDPFRYSATKQYLETIAQIIAIIKNRDS